MELHHHTYKIWLLYLVKSSGSVSLAARHAKISASAVSQAIGQLETFLGQKVIDRVGRTTALTEAGELLIVALKPALMQLSSFDPSFLSPTSSPVQLRIGAYESIAIDLMPRLMTMLKRKWPLMRVSLQMDRSRSLLEQVSDGELDVALIAEPPKNPRLYIKNFAKDSFGLFIHRSAAHGRSFEQILHEFGLGILKTDDHLHTKSFSKFMNRFDLTASATLETWSFEVILALARAGSTVGVLPLRVAKRFESELVRIDTPFRDTEVDPGVHHLAAACRPEFSKQIFTSILNEVT
jgi:molybdate transport repressor ModE-like protein